jgi:6-pyruvoyl-tetrahydropterin synthase
VGEKMIKSSMFLGDTTNVDHAYINNLGDIVGGSYRPKFTVTGKVDPVEKVVVDFSTVKKSLKAAIDDTEDGFDHKLWWIEGESLGNITFTGATVSIVTPKVKIYGPKNIVKVVTSSTSFNDYCLSALQKKHPTVDIELETVLTTNFDIMPQLNSMPHMFRYVHGLKESTSWGCQNIGHGHLSYIAANTTNTLATDLLLAEIARDLDGVIFAWADNMPTENLIEYHCGRGPMSMEFVGDVKLVKLTTETTVEFLVDYVIDRYEHQLKQAGVTILFVSEGLSKGACRGINV